jgi:serine/threonine protein kinase
LADVTHLIGCQGERCGRRDVKNKLHWHNPTIVLSDSPDDLRSDSRAGIYSLGVVLDEVLTGHLPFEAGSPAPSAAMMEAMATEHSLAVPSFHGLDAPKALDGSIRKSLEPDPAQRYQQANQLAEDLQALLDGWPLRYASEPSRAERLRHWVARRLPAFSPR